jgi:hypothetical protein
MIFLFGAYHFMGNQAGPVDKPTPVHATASNCSESTTAHLVENTPEVKNL